MMTLALRASRIAKLLSVIVMSKGVAKRSAHFLSSFRNPAAETRNFKLICGVRNPTPIIRRSLSLNGVGFLTSPLRFAAELHSK